MIAGALGTMLDAAPPIAVAVVLIGLGLQIAFTNSMFLGLP